MLKTAREEAELGSDVPDARASIVLNPKRPVARHLDKGERARLGKATKDDCALNPTYFPSPVV